MSAKEHKTKKGNYWTIETLDKKQVDKKLRKLRVRREWFQSEWVRSGNYRKDFFAANKGPYRCRYCNRLLKKDYMEIDHLIPIDKAKVKGHYRRVLEKKGIRNVNDIRNLVPACQRCNRLKGSKTGIWYIKGILGQYPTYWKIRRFILIILEIVFVIGCIYLYKQFAPF